MTDWVQKALEIAPKLAAQADEHDANDTFVTENYALLRERRFFSALVPADLGGGGASPAEMCEVLRILAYHCPSTALAFSMHVHNGLTLRWRHLHGQPTTALLKRIAAEELVLVTSGGSDWLNSSGVATKVEGGFRVKGRKVFASGSPGGSLFLTSAVHEDPAAGPTVLMFGVPFGAQGIKVLDNWRTHGMRGTGSNDVVLEDLFVADGAVAGKRPKGELVPIFFVIAQNFVPASYSAYFGAAEAARDIAVKAATAKRADVATQILAGELDTELEAARLVLRAVVDRLDSIEATPEGMNRVMMARVLLARSFQRIGEKAMETAGGGSYFRSSPLERYVRDLRASMFHPLQEKPQAIFAGRLALGLPPA